MKIEIYGYMYLNKYVPLYHANFRLQCTKSEGSKSATQVRYSICWGRTAMNLYLHQTLTHYCPPPSVAKSSLSHVGAVCLHSVKSVEGFGVGKEYIFQEQREVNLI